MTDEKAIELQGIVCSLDGRPVLEGVDLGVARGETVAVLGESGTGKTTLLRVVMGLVKPQAGRLILWGDDVTNLPERELNQYRKRMGMVFQGAALFDSMTVGENVAFGLRQHTKMSDAEIGRVVSEKLALVGLEGIESMMPAQLSGGMKKRVGIARALAMEPEIVLYDEPTGGLDPPRALEIEQLIADLSRRLGVTSLWVLHDVQAALACADRVALLHEGRIAAQGTPEQIARDDNPLVRRFISSARRETA